MDIIHPVYYEISDLGDVLLFGTAASSLLYLLPTAIGFLTRS